MNILKVFSLSTLLTPRNCGLIRFRPIRYRLIRYRFIRPHSGTTILSLSSFYGSSSTGFKFDYKIKTLKYKKNYNKNELYNSIRTASLSCFSFDHRIKEVLRILCSAQKPVRVRVERRPETTDHDLILLQQRHMLSLLQRSLASPIGLGAMNSYVS